MALFGSGIAELTKHRAEQMVKDLVKGGEIGPKGASSLVKDLVDRSRENRKELVRFVRGEIKNQIEGLGLATKRDFERLERRIGRLEDTAKKDREAATSVGSLERRLDKLESSQKTARAKTTAKSTAKTAKKATGRAPGTKPKSTMTRKTTARGTGSGTGGTGGEA
jgi:polyhydroxyalkanoate synthesis regulator phasin